MVFRYVDKVIDRSCFTRLLRDAQHSLTANRDIEPVHKLLRVQGFL